MKPGTEHCFVGTPVLPFAEKPDPERLRERFHRVILGAGYTEEASQKIIAEYFDFYMRDLPNFLRMLKSYEAGHGDD